MAWTRGRSFGGINKSGQSIGLPAGKKGRTRIPDAKCCHELFPLSAFRKGRIIPPALIVARRSNRKLARRSKMKREYHRWFSHRLGLDMGVVVYGHWGPPLLGFPTSAGDEWELENQGLIGSLAPLIDGGRVK